MHKHSHSHQDKDRSRQNIAIAFLLNLSFTLIEFVGGMLTNSIAIISDAVHDLGDSISLAFAWYFEKLSKRSPTIKYSYGYKRFSILGALLNCIILLIGSIIVIYECVKRIIEPQNVKVEGMFILAIIGIVVNGFAVWRTSKGKGVNERVVSLHLLEDVLGWAAVLVVSIVMFFVDLPILDPLLSIGIALFILYNVVRNMRIALKVILEGVPLDMDIYKLKQKVETIPAIESVHDLHVWSLDGQYNVASAHVVVKQENNSLEELAPVKEQIRILMKEEGIEHVTIEFENEQEYCSPCDKDFIEKKIIDEQR
ncbi:MAG: cation diffusion facilitator family transporter [Bacteroidales bacterium]|jgi:cobalt-zinc-cadmium efflux system protein|nr:cation diffusion facilitator family transporter [Bacteroidales bacterium]